MGFILNFNESVMSGRLTTLVSIYSHVPEDVIEINFQENVVLHNIASVSHLIINNVLLPLNSIDDDSSETI